MAYYHAVECPPVESLEARVEPILDLDFDVAQLQRTVLMSVVADPQVRNLAGRLRNIDEPTYEHCERVSGLVIGTMLASGADPAEAFIGGVAGILHDIGKGSRVVQLAVKSYNSIADNPELYDLLRLHPRIGAAIAQHQGFGPNVVQAIGYHHAFQGNGRPAYGMQAGIISLPEADGLAPDTPRLAHTLAACDLVDAMLFDPQRNYRCGSCCSPEDTVQEVRSLQIPDAVIDQVLRVTGITKL
ncbi:MAG: hypothetical protein JWM81_185 [Candidatus Saccharibacteria bacterium]|nr:hypothetical protein [Candidatus Saccharibacteria bacterium]